MPRRNEKQNSAPSGEPRLKLDIIALRRKYQILSLVGDEDVAEGYVAALAEKLSPCENDKCVWKYIPKQNFQKLVPEKAVEFRFGAFTCVVCCKIRPATREEQAEYVKVNKRTHRGEYETFERYVRRTKEL